MADSQSVNQNTYSQILRSGSAWIYMSNITKINYININQYVIYHLIIIKNMCFLDFIIEIY